MLDLTNIALVGAGLAAFLVGLAKTGVPGIGILVVTLLAGIFPARLSVGILLPLLIAGDVFAVIYYRRHAEWPRLWRLFPWVAVGLGAGFLILGHLNNENMRPVLGGLVLALLGLEQARRHWGWENMPRHWWFSAGTGILAGIATMIGNVAGPIMSIYFISCGMDKKKFMGTGAWYFFIVNTIKVPFFMYRGMITLKTARIDALALGLVILGALFGRRLLLILPQQIFNALVLGLAAIGAIRLLFF